jgi:hypothetical protein
MVCPVIDNPASCETRVVILFFHAKNTSAAEIHRELCAVYSQNGMSEGTVRQRCRMFKDGRANKCSRRRGKWSAGHLSCVMILYKVLIKYLLKTVFTFSELSCGFLQISSTLLYEIITS